MSSKEFSSLQKSHDGLLQRQSNLSDEDRQRFSEDVKEYIAQAKKVGANISLAEEREQLRANLRYWAIYIYGVEGQLPDTDLAPFTSRKRFYAISLGMMILVLLVVLIFGFSLSAVPQFTSTQWTAIAQTQQVMASTSNDRIKYWLNAVPTDFDKFDELERSLVGKYEVIGVSFPTDNYFEIDMNCECATGSACCVPERMFLLTLQKMARSQDQILAAVPENIEYLDVVFFDHNRAFYAMYAPWDTVKKFLTGGASTADLKASITPKDMR
jgi:hypothetical protein